MCSLNDIVEHAQMETAIDVGALASEMVLTSHLLRYRQRLVAKLSHVWKDATGDVIEVSVSLVGGWSFAWGDNWGGTVISIDRDVAAMEAIWEARAHRLSDDSWPIVHVASISDDANNGRPALMLRNRSLALLGYDVDWKGKYDTIRLYGVAVPPVTGIDPTAELAPNELLAPAFCRCLTLEGARYLHILDDNMLAAGSVAAELAVALSDLLAQAQGHNLTVASRQCQLP